MANCIQILLDNFQNARKHLVTCLAYLTLRIYGSEPSYQAVKSGTFSTRKYAPLRLENAEDLDTLLALSDHNLTMSEDRRSVVSEKCKTLLTLGSLLLGAVGLLLPKYLAFDSLWMRCVSVLAILILFNALLILLAFFDVGTDMSVSLVQEDTTLDEANLKKSLINRKLQCREAMENRTDYLVELYKAARFCFLTALTLIAALVLSNLAGTNLADQTERIVREIRSDSHLLELLRGPKGDQGLTGGRGHDGGTGRKGDKGDAGHDAIVDVNDVVKQLSLNAQFVETIRKAIAKPTSAPSSQP